MDTLRKWVGFEGPSSSPAVVAADDVVYPMHMLDNTSVLRSIVVTWTLRFDDVLDAEKLRSSLTSLLELGDWRKVGGRLRLKENGQLDIYAPSAFTPERPAVSFSHQSHSVSIDQHPTASLLPKATDAPSLQDGPQKFREFAARDDAPQTLEDYLAGDVPMLALHVTSFADATLVGLSWPHVLMDVMGQKALMRAWSLVLAGKVGDVLPMLGSHEDMLSAATEYQPESPEEEFHMGKKQLRGWAMASFGLRFGWDMLWNPTIECKSIFLPRKSVEALQTQASKDLEALHGVGNAPFVSEGDVLTAWATRAIASSLPQPRPLTIIHAVNARFRLPSLAKARGVFVQNMALGAFTFLSPRDSVDSLGSMALVNRQHLAEQTTEAQLLAYIRHLKQLPAAESDPAMVCGSADALLVPFTNWTKADVYNVVDFGPAVVRTGGGAEPGGRGAGALVYHHSQAMRTGPTTRNVVVIMGKDNSGNYWLNAYLTPQAWARIGEEVAKM